MDEQSRGELLRSIVPELQMLRHALHSLVRKDVSDVLDGDRKTLRRLRHRERDVEPRRPVINVDMAGSQTQKLHRRRFGKIEIKKRHLRNRIAARILYRL